MSAEQRSQRISEMSAPSSRTYKIAPENSMMATHEAMTTFQNGTTATGDGTMASQNELVPSQDENFGPAHAKLTKEDLELFHRNLVRGSEPFPSLKSSLQRLRNFLEGANTSPVLAKILQPVKREVRRCQREFETAEADLQSRMNESASMIDDGKFREALPVMLTGHQIIRTLVTRLDKLNVSLHEVPSKASKSRSKADLETIDYDDEITAYRASVTEWHTHCLLPSWASVARSV